MIRVRLFGRKPKAKETLTITAPFSISDSRTGTIFGDAQPPISDCVVSPSAPSAVYIGEKVISSADILLTPSRDAAIVIGGQTYRGLLRIQREGAGLVFTNHVDIEAYLRGVLRSELPRYFQPESFKAQCVAARTYALYSKRFNQAGRTFDVYDDEGSQVYKGVAMEDRVAVEAVESTRGEVCMWKYGDKDDIFCTYYSSCCGGLSQHVRNVKPNDPDVAPLAGGVSCNDCSGATHFKWPPVRLSKAEVTRRIVARYPTLKKLGTITKLAPKRTSPDGRVITMELTGATGKKETLMGEDFRLCMGGRHLKSTRFNLVVEKDAYVFKDGQGFGHGMGLCQFGMDTKARRGMDYKQILSFYYPGSYVKRLYDDNPPPV